MTFSSDRIALAVLFSIFGAHAFIALLQFSEYLGNIGTKKMANHKSALKRAKQSEKRAERNRDRISRVKTFIKKFISSLGTENAASAFSEAQSEIQRGVSKGAMHRNTANRKISRLNKLLKPSETAQ